MRYCLRSIVVYKFLYGRSNATYYGKTCRYLSIRVSEHSSVLPLTGKKSKSKNSTANSTLFCDNIVFIENLKIFATSDSDFHIKFKESLLKPSLKNETSLTLSYLTDPSHIKFIIMIFAVVTVIKHLSLKCSRGF